MVHNKESEYMDPWIVNAFKPLLVINDYDKYILKYGVVYLSSNQILECLHQGDFQ